MSTPSVQTTSTPDMAQQHAIKTPMKAAMKATMKAVVRDRYGDADALRLADVPLPSVGDEQVLVEVHAAALDRGAWHMMRGRPYLARLSFGLRKPKNIKLGLDMAGVVQAVGPNVVGFKVGDEVFGTCDGAFAEYAAARADRLALMPERASFTEAAAVPVSGVTALQALRDHGRVQAGQRVLILGASGGVGTFAVQLAKVFGAVVTGVCSAAKLELVQGLGADEVLDYTKADLEGQTGRFDLVLAIGGSLPLAQLRRLLGGQGTLVIVGGESRSMMRRLLGAALLAPFIRRQRIVTFVARENGKDLETLAELMAAGTLAPALDSVRTLAEVPAAMRDLGAGRVRGKVVFAVAPSLETHPLLEPSLTQRLRQGSAPHPIVGKA